MFNSLTNLVYLVSAALFILGLRGMSHPRTAVQGNAMAAAGMLLAVVITLVGQQIVDLYVILAGIVVGSLVGGLVAWRVPVTAMPQLVALLNGFGGGASALVAVVALGSVSAVSAAFEIQIVASAGASVLVGTVTFFGSMVAFGKLQRLLPERPITIPGYRPINAVVAVAGLALLAALLILSDAPWVLWALLAAAGILGIMVVIPIGGADMPVIISFLNSCSGLAAAATGFALSNSVLIIAGSLVGAAGLILTLHMSRAMNRSLANVFFGAVGAPVADRAAAEEIYAGKVKSTTPEEVAMLIQSARRVVIAPGFGLATAQAQHAVKDLMNRMEAMGVEVEFAIHPVAGRMPGHMNVLLAEADIPYEKLREMTEINPTFRQTDLVLVIGANDVVNPMAREADPSIPIAGMPILNVDQAHAVVVIKRSLSPGFAGIPNPLFAAENTLMLYGDAKQMVTDLLAALGTGAGATAGGR